MRRKHVPNCVHRLLGLAFLHETNDGVDSDHSEDHRHIDEVTERGCYGSRSQQDVDQDVVELEQ
jgi:hypothetical protein